MTESPERLKVRRALDGLKPYLEAFVGGLASRERRSAPVDTAALLKEMLLRWEARFGQELPPVGRSYIHELLDVRNRWAHEVPFTPTEAERAADTARQLARLIGAPDPLSRQGSPSASPRLPRAVTNTTKWSGQRETMRAIWRRVLGDEARAVAEYVAAEEAGLVVRKTNKSGYTPERYAKALIADGLRKGWLELRSSNER